MTVDFEKHVVHTIFRPLMVPATVTQRQPKSVEGVGPVQARDDGPRLVRD